MKCDLFFFFRLFAVWPAQTKTLCPSAHTRSVCVGCDDATRQSREEFKSYHLYCFNVIFSYFCSTIFSSRLSQLLPLSHKMLLLHASIHLPDGASTPNDWRGTHDLNVSNDFYDTFNGDDFLLFDDLFVVGFQPSSADEWLRALVSQRLFHHTLESCNKNINQVCGILFEPLTVLAVYITHLQHIGLHDRHLHVAQCVVDAI